MEGVKLFALPPIVALAAFAFALPVERTVYQADTQATILKWKGYKVTGEHEGTVKLKEGFLVYEDGKLAGGEFVIDMTTIEDTDLQGQWKAKLENHLKSDDFFGVDRYPTSKFVITRVVPQGPGKYKIIGNLTIKGITKEIRFVADVQENGDSVVADARITVDRAEFNVRYGSGSFFDNLGDKTIYDEFDLWVHLVTRKAA